ncbi:MAG: CorA family divalent cation transporter, partial [Patescibacteria group bacterium]
MKYMNIQTVIFDKLSFINVTNPGDLEIKYLKTNFDFDTLHLDDYINKTQIPKIETFKNYTLLVMDIPYYNLSLVSTATPNNTKPSEDKTPTKTTLESIMPSSLSNMY